MNYAVAVLIILIILVLFWTSSQGKKDGFTIFPRYFQNIYNDFNPNDIVVLKNHSPPYVKLYEGFEWRDRVFDISTLDYPHLRLLQPIDLKSVDIDLSDAPTGQKVTLWSVYPNDVEASTVATGIYTDIYREPEYAFRANSPKYQKIAEVTSGEIFKENLDQVVKRVFIVVE